MKKYAFFVEGQTEALFVIWFIQQIAQRLDVSINVDHKRARGGSRLSYPRTFHDVTILSDDDNLEFFFLIVDCGCDAKLVHDVKMRLTRLETEGFEKVYTLRDVYPDYSYDEFDLLKEGMTEELDKLSIECTDLFSVM